MAIPRRPSSPPSTSTARSPREEASLTGWRHRGRGAPVAPRCASGAARHRRPSRRAAGPTARRSGSSRTPRRYRLDDVVAASRTFARITSNTKAALPFSPASLASGAGPRRRHRLGLTPDLRRRHDRGSARRPAGSARDWPSTREGRLTGGYLGKNCRGTEKLRRLDEWIAQRDYPAPTRDLRLRELAR